MLERLRDFLLNSDWQALFFQWGLGLVIALTIFVIGRWVARAVTRALRRLMELRELDQTLITFMSNLVYALLVTAVIIAALDSLGMPVTSLVAVLGAAGLAIGLALKDSLGNFAAGVMLVMFRPFIKGDFVEVAGVSGVVEELRIFSTYLVTGDNKLVIIPNGQIAGNTITNFTAMDQRRIDLLIGVSYKDDLKVARSVLERVCKEHPQVLDEPATSIFVFNLGDSSVEFAVRPWCPTDVYWQVRGDILERAKIELEACGCSIPYPQRDVYVHPANSQEHDNGK